MKAGGLGLLLDGATAKQGLELSLCARLPAPLRIGRAPRSHVVKKGTWRPLLQGAIVKDALEAVDAIAEAILESPTASLPRPRAARKKLLRDASLAGGTAGLAVFYRYLSRVTSSDDHKKTALRYLQEAGDAVESVVMDPSLYGGFAGVAWAMAHLQGKLFEPDEEISTEAIDEALRDHVNRRRWRGDYDLVSGLVGFGVYALVRLPSPAAVACLEGVIDRLEETSRRSATCRRRTLSIFALEPMFAAILAALFFQERLSPRGFAGGALVLPASSFRN